MKLPKIIFSGWKKWEQRNEMAGIDKPGVYLIAKFPNYVPNKVDAQDNSIIYIGETCKSLKNRLNQFNRSAFQSGRNHSGSRKYKRQINDKGKDLYVTTSISIDSQKNLTDLSIKYMERKLILEYAIKNIKAPKLNKN